MSGGKVAIKVKIKIPMEKASESKGPKAPVVKRGGKRGAERGMARK